MDRGSDRGASQSDILEDQRMASSLVCYRKAGIQLEIVREGKSQRRSDQIGKRLKTLMIQGLAKHAADNGFCSKLSGDALQGFDLCETKFLKNYSDTCVENSHRWMQRETGDSI